MFRTSMLLHFRPRKVPAQALRFSLTWGLGGMALVLVVLLFTTGVLLKFHYQPSPERAYESIVFLRDHVRFGQFFRNIHHWSGNLLVIVVFLHFLRVFFTGAFKAPRRLNWMIGLCLFLCVLLANFTGYLLPWDQLAFWAVTVTTGILDYVPLAGSFLQDVIRGGTSVGAGTLTYFHAFHTAILPALFLFFLPYHFWRVRKDGGVVVDRGNAKESESVPSIPNLILREIVTALVVIAVVFVVSALFDAPLLDKANPGLSPNPTKAPWYFMGFQESLLHGHPLAAAFLVPLMMVIALLSIPYLNYPTESSGTWFVSLKGRRTAAWAAILAWIVTPLGIALDEFAALPGSWGKTLFPDAGYGVILGAVILLAGTACYPLIKRKYALNLHESVQMLFVFFLHVFIILTVAGIWFRGSAMRLSWPWMS